MTTTLSTRAQNISPPTLRDITRKVQAVSGINLGQGVCQLPTPEAVTRGAKRALDEGVNRYTSPRGLLSLREAITSKLKRHNNLEIDPEREIIITAGATGAFEGVCATLLDEGDEVVSFSPFYPYHHNTLMRYGAQLNYIELESPDWTFAEEALEAAFSERTKFVVVNTPGNPSGKVFTKPELEFIATLAERYDCYVVTDEIYEYMTFDGREHISPASIPALSGRAISIGGYSKTFAITGWRIGFVAMPAELASKAVPMFDSIYVCPPAPLQQGVAYALEELGDEYYHELNKMYQAKRNMFAESLLSAGLKPHIPQGSYYLMADFSEAFPEMDAMSFVEMMIEKTGVGGVPARDFVQDETGQQWVRFCFAVEDDDLAEACRRLQKLAG